METEPKNRQQTSAGSLSDRIDVILGRIYNYHGEPKPPKATKDTWGAPVQLPPETTSAEGYFLHYFQSQGLGPTNNECVTTSTVMAMNMMEDRVRAGKGLPIQF
ncbi:MAG TPA: hypothetical protein VIV15_00265, partial [Anaerolineales bacterium]